MLYAVDVESRVLLPTTDFPVKKFYCRPITPTFFRKKPFGENVEGLSYCGDGSCGSQIVFK